MICPLCNGDCVLGGELCPECRGFGVVAHPLDIPRPSGRVLLRTVAIAAWTALLAIALWRLLG